MNVKERILIHSERRLSGSVPTFLDDSVEEHPGDIIIDVDWSGRGLVPEVSVRRVP